jgi:2,4-dienoyl-CoA reductase-like NADH-dependent reductase (Old Yellow Enzyme family)
VPIFENMKIRDLIIPNRVWVSPMCQYSADNGFTSQWHRIHYGALATGGSGLVIIEATGVVPEGRISTACLGIWDDARAEAFRPIVEFAHSMGRKIGIQLAHAGRKGSVLEPAEKMTIANSSQGGWQTVSASPFPFFGMQTPHELSIQEIEELEDRFVEAAKRAVLVGFDLIEIHGAHGYLAHQFFSPLANQRTDKYGGNFEGRTRFLREVAEKVRKAIPEGMPLFVRISATDWVEGGWDLQQSIALSIQLKGLGVDLIDVSSGGLVHNAVIPVAPGYQVPLASEIRERSGIATAAVGLITEPEQAAQIIASGQADAVLLARAMLRNPRWALNAADALGVAIEWPRQLKRGSRPKS